jgi:hypothetical protein
MAPFSKVMLRSSVDIVKLVELCVVPAPFVTLIGPVVAPAGTVVVIWVSGVSVKLAAVQLNVTVVVPVKFDPVRVTVVPAGASNGLKEEIVGGTEPYGGTTVNTRPLLPTPATVTMTVFEPRATAGTLI